MPHSIYIHIPFCANRCYYCAFNTYVTENQQLVWDYLNALKREMIETMAKDPPERIETIFVGGGTPTFLNYEQMEFFLESIQTVLPHKSVDLEFTMEANPGTTDPEKLKIMRQGGVNRLSFGVQAFHDGLLQRIGRDHDVKQALKSIYDAGMAGFDNISIDLMFGLPEQTKEIFKQTLDQAFSLDLQHFSAYSLKVEENTLFHVLYEKNQLKLPPEDDEADMYEIVCSEMQKHGYLQYEISNFSKNGYESRHNQTYWKNEEYYGVGAGAHGYVNHMRHVNSGPLLHYIKHIHEKGLARIKEFPVTKQEAMEEFMILGLRLMKGISKAEFADRYGQPLEHIFGEHIEQLCKEGLLVVTGDRICLTERGIPLGNEVFVRFLDS